VEGGRGEGSESECVEHEERGGSLLPLCAPQGTLTLFIKYNVLYFILNFYFSQEKSLG